MSFVLAARVLPAPSHADTVAAEVCGAEDEAAVVVEVVAVARLAPLPARRALPGRVARERRAAIAEARNGAERFAARPAFGLAARLKRREGARPRADGTVAALQTAGAAFLLGDQTELREASVACATGEEVTVVEAAFEVLAEPRLRDRVADLLFPEARLAASLTTGRIAPAAVGPLGAWPVRHGTAGVGGAAAPAEGGVSAAIGVEHALALQVLAHLRATDAVLAGQVFAAVAVYVAPVAGVLAGADPLATGS